MRRPAPSSNASGATHPATERPAGPATGDAGYVAMEVFDGSLGGRRGTVVMQQRGVIRAGQPALVYELVPGSGTGELVGVNGSVELELFDGVHHVTITIDGAPTDG